MKAKFLLILLAACFFNFQVIAQTCPHSIVGTGTPTCVGGSTGTITAVASGGVAPYTYSLNGGTYQSSTLFTGLAAGGYTLRVRGNTGCISSTSVNITPFPASTDNQNTAGTNSWIGHVYTGTNFTSYIGNYTENEVFNQNFGGNSTCFNITSNSTSRSIFTDNFSVKYRMNSTRKGLFSVDLGSDDGSRLTVDGTLIYNNWVDQGFSIKPSVLMKLTGTSTLLYEFYENGGGNQVAFQNETLIIANTLTGNTTQTICGPGTGLTISGDVYGALPAGISLSGTGYQWAYSTSPGGTRINISGATAATYTPAGNISPFNAAGTYYLYRTTKLVSTNNVNLASYTSSLESNAATVTVSTANLSQLPAAGIIANYRFDGNADDAASNNAGTLQGAPAQSADRFNVANKAFSFNGSSDYVSTANSYNNPNDFTISLWFKTATTSGGKLIGFGNAQTGSSGQYDRHIYMNNAGQIYFGVYPNTVVTVNSSASYNDDTWHLATATLSAAGMVLYVDGVQVGSNSTTTVGQDYVGYWRIAYDNCSGWTSSPSNFYFNGRLDDVLIYSRALSAGEVGVLYNSPDGAGNNGPVCAGSMLSLSVTNVPGATYSWTGPNGFTSSVRNPSFVYSSAFDGIYTVQVISGGCASTAYTKVVSTGVDGQWTGSISTDWANPDNWCGGAVPTSATNVTIAAGAVRMPVISSSVVCNNLLVNAGASVTTNAAGTLNVAGNILNNGTMTNSGTTIFNGTGGQQSFTGTTVFTNLVLKNSGGLVLPAAITVSGNLTLTTGILTTNNFAISIAGNWTNNSGTNAYVGGTSVVIFNGSSNQVISGSAATTFNNITVNNNTNVLSLAVNANISSDLTISSGTFDLGAFTANRVTAGGTLVVDNNATLKIGGTNTFPSNFSTSNLAVSGSVEYAGTNQTIANKTYGNLKLSSSAGAAVKTFPGSAMTVVGNLSSTQGAGTSVSYNAGAAITVNGNVSIGAATTFNGSSFTHNIGGNWTNAGTFNGNTGKIIFDGAGKIVSGSGAQNFNDLTVAAPGVSFANGTISLSGNLATTGSGTFSQASGGTLIMTGNAKTISGTGISLDNLTISGTVTSAVLIDLTGNLNVSGSFTTTAGSFIMSGAGKTISGSGTANFFNLSAVGTITATANFTIVSGLVVSGSLKATAGTATFTGTAVLSGTADLYNVTENGTYLQLSANSTLGVASTLTLASGTLNVTSSVPNTVNFNGNGAQNINAITYDNLRITGAGSNTALGAITVNRNITIGGSATFVGGSYTHSIYRNWNNNGTYTAGTGTVQFLGNQSSNISGETTFNTLTINANSASSGAVLKSNITASLVNMIQGNTFTEDNTLTITNTRTGNGIILGNITRTHAFTTGVAYAFEGPDNSITFASVSGVTSVTVSVVPGAVSDFPFGGSIARQYTIAVPAGTYNATLRLHYEDNELNGSNESSMALWKFNGSIWTAIGKTGNSTSANYVEQSGLTNITNRWTCSDNASVVEWNGSLSNDWNTAVNWTVIQGSASRPPAPTDIVNLGTSTFNFNPTISTVVAVKNIKFGSVKAVTLSMAPGGSLTTGDMSGTWGANATHTINANNQAITTTGNLVLSDNTAGHKINLNIGNGVVTVRGDLSQSGTASINCSGAGTLNIGGDYNYIDGAFTAGSGTVNYNGQLNQVAGPVTYNNLTVNKTAALASINNTLLINGNLEVIAGELVNYATTSVLGNVTIYAGATLNNNSVLKVGGNWLNNGNYYATGTATNIIFDGSGSQSISATTFNNLEIAKAPGSVATLTGDVILKGNLVGTSGTLDIKNFFFNRDVAGGSASIADGATLIIGVDNAPNLFSNYFLSPGSTVIFNGTTDQHLLLPGVVYGNIVFRNSGNKILYTPITVNTSLTIENGATFNGGNNVITLNGNWINNGVFVPASSTILANGSAKTISGNNTFNNLTATGSYSFLGNNTFNGLINITSTGSLSAAAGITTTLHADLINSGILFTLGTTTFTGNVAQTLSLIDAVQTVAVTVNFNGTVSPVLNSTSSPVFGYLNINNTGGVNPSVGWTIQNGFTVGAGASFNGGGSSHTFNGNVTNNGTITGSGTFAFLPSGPVTINLGTGFSNTGRVYFGGATPITLLGTPVSFFDLNINNTNSIGITPSSDWTVTNNLRVTTNAVLHASNYRYFVGGNIVVSGLIDSQGSTFILNGTGTQDVNAAAAFKNFTIDKASGYCSLSKNLTVDGVLNFRKGLIQTGTFSVIQPASGSVTGTSQNTGWVAGKFQKAIAAGTVNKTFEVGDNSVYSPLSLVFTGVSAGGDLTATSIAGDHPNLTSSNINPSLSLNRYWKLSNSGISFTNVTGTFNFAGADVDAGASTANFKASVYNGSSWTEPATLNPNATNIQAANVTALGDFAFGQICNFGTTINYPSSPYCTTSGMAAVTITGTAGGVFSAGAGLSINAATGAINLAASTPGTYTVLYKISATADCRQFNTYATITVAFPDTWIGAIGTDWTNPGNWSCNVVPLPSADVIIPAGNLNYPSIVNSVSLHDLKIAAGASLLLNTGTLKISGAITNDGTLNAALGTIEMNGTSAQILPLNIFVNNAVMNLDISNTSITGVTLAGALDVYGKLSLTGSGVKLNTGDLLTLRSTAANTARVGNLTGNSILGKVTVERFVNTGTGPGQFPQSWQLLSTPAKGATIHESWQEAGNFPAGYGSWITGPSGIGLDAISPGYSMKYYNSTLENYVGVDSTNVPINNKNGYYIFVRGDRTITSPGPGAPTILRIKGTLYQPIDAPQTVQVPVGKYQSVGNPYASPINLAYMKQNGYFTNLNHDVIVWDPSIAGSYNVGGYQTLSAANNFEPTIGGPASALYPAGISWPYIQSGQAFFMHSANGAVADGSVSFGEGIKYDGIVSAHREAQSVTAGRQYFRTTLYTGSNVIADGNAVVFDDVFSNNIDPDDALKISNGGENIGILRNASLLAVEARSPVQETDTIFYDLTHLRQISYKLKFSPRDMQTNLSAWLVDNYLNTTTLINLSDSSTVDFEVNAAPASAAKDRFKVIFKTNTVLPLKITGISATRLADKKVDVQWQVAYEENVATYSIQRSLDGINFVNIGSKLPLNNSGSAQRYNFFDATVAENSAYFYRVLAADKDGKIVYSNVAKVAALLQEASVTVFPNPIRDSKINLQFSNMPVGRYSIQFTNSLGQIVYRSAVDISSGNERKIIILPAGVVNGNYQLKMVSAAGKDMVVQVTVQ